VNADLVRTLATYAIAVLILLGAFVLIYTAKGDPSQSWLVVGAIVGYIFRDSAGAQATANVSRINASPSRAGRQRPAGRPGDRQRARPAVGKQRGRVLASRSLSVACPQSPHDRVARQSTRRSAADDDLPRPGRRHDHRRPGTGSGPSADSDSGPDDARVPVASSEQPDRQGRRQLGPHRERDDPRSRRVSPSGIGITVRNVAGTVTIRNVDLADLVGRSTSTTARAPCWSRTFAAATSATGRSVPATPTTSSSPSAPSAEPSATTASSPAAPRTCSRSGTPGGRARQELVVEGNHLQGLVTDTATARAWTRGSGTGIIVSDGAGSSRNGYVIVRNNTLLTPGQVGIQHIDGPGIQTYSNVIYGQKRPGNNNPMTSWEGNPRGVVRDNRYFWTNDDGSQPTPWFSGYGSMVLTNNVKDSTIDPKALEVVL
jgi:hypothetical protein